MTLYWLCEECKAQSFYEGNLVMKCCRRCGSSMKKVVEDKTLEAVKNG